MTAKIKEYVEKHRGEDYANLYKTSFGDKEKDLAI